MSTLTPTRPDAGPMPAEPHVWGHRDVGIVYWAFGVFYALLSFGVVVLGRATPPPRPDVSQAQAVAWFGHHHGGIQIGFVALLVLAGGAAISNGIIGYFMMRMSGGKVWSYAYIAGMGVGAIPGFQLLLVCWLTAEFRPDRDPRVLYMLYDLGMLSYNGSMGCFTIAYLVLAVAILYDRNQTFPKWFAYVSIWQIITEVLATQMWVFHAGAFAWNGFITLWFALLIFGLWVVCLLWIMRVAGGRETRRTPPLFAPDAER